MEFKLPTLPTRQECKDIVEKTEAFFVSETIVEGQKVEMYNYRLASLSDFVDYNAFELRGITFTQNSDDTWERNILLNKFFNVSQTEGWMYDDLKNKKITRVQNKEDGSVISFCRFENGKVSAKSKMSFTSEQAVMAQEVYDKDEGIREFIENMMSEESTPIFELCSPHNQIVLEYFETELILLQVRNKNGTYQSGDELEYYTSNYGVQRAIQFSSRYNNLDFLLKEKETSQENIEGWIVTFEDGQMAKIKTNKYLSLHGLIGPDAFRENLLVQTILNGNIDDVIAALVPGAKKDKIIAMDEKLTHHFNHLVVEFKELRRKYFQDFKEVRKDFAIAHSKDEAFSGVMKTLKTSFRDVEKTAEYQVKIYISRKCNSLNDAKKYLEGL